MNWVKYNEHDELVRAMDQIKTLEHNLSAEMEAAGCLYQELIEKDVIINSLEKRLRKATLLLELCYDLMDDEELQILDDAEESCH